MKLVSKSLAKVKKLLELSKIVELDGVSHKIAYKKTTSFNGKVHSLAKLSYCLAKGINIEGIDASTIWVRRTCAHPLCILPEHLELLGAGATKKKTLGEITEEEIQEELRKEEEKLFAEFIKND